MVGEIDWLISLLRHCQDRFLNKVVQPRQIVAWKKTFSILKRAIAESVQLHLAAGQSMIVFEYELPFEDGNRPDVILVLLSGHVVVNRPSAELSACILREMPMKEQQSTVLFIRSILSTRTGQASVWCAG
jgi:hypothetical protein